MDNKSQIKRGRPRKAASWTAPLLRERAGEYFAKQDSVSKMIIGRGGPVNVPAPAPYSIEGLCVYLGISRSLWAQWQAREDRLGEAARQLHLIVMANRVEGALAGDQNPAFAQFMLKNNDPENYRDRNETELSLDDGAGGIITEALKSWQKILKR